MERPLQPRDIHKSVKFIKREGYDCTKGEQGRGENTRSVWGDDKEKEWAKSYVRGERKSGEEWGLNRFSVIPGERTLCRTKVTVHKYGQLLVHIYNIQPRTKSTEKQTYVEYTLFVTYYQFTQYHVIVRCYQ